MANFELEPCIGDGPIEPLVGEFQGPEITNIQAKPNKPFLSIFSKGTDAITGKDASVAGGTSDFDKEGREQKIFDKLPKGAVVEFKHTQMKVTISMTTKVVDD